MKRFLFALFPLLLVVSACAPAIPASDLPDLPFVVTITTGRQPAPSPDNNPTQPAQPEQPAAPTSSPTHTPLPPTHTPTANPSYTPVLPTPTETQLPALDLPTEQSSPPARAAWTGLPTYPGDSDPGLLFSVDYDPTLWAQTEGLFGDIVLGSRQIEYCTITPWSGRGLPVDWKVTHDFRNIGSTAFDVNTVTSQGQIKFISYVGGDILPGKPGILTGFQVSFKQQQDQCLQQAEVIFGTLRSLAAAPTATPNP